MGPMAAIAGTPDCETEEGRSLTPDHGNRQMRAQRGERKQLCANGEARQMLFDAAQEDVASMKRALTLQHHK